MLSLVRPPAVAGTFYPDAPAVLSDLVDRLLAEAAVRAQKLPHGARHGPKALIVPHAGYVYSGPVAASAYVTWSSLAEVVSRVVLIGPAHRAFVAGLVTPGADVLATPLGKMTVDRAAIAKLTGVPENRAAHAREHSLEVQLPFLQRVLPRASIVPLAVGEAAPEAVGHVLEALWGGPETRIVVSSDLSHYHSYEEARARDTQTAERIVGLSRAFPNNGGETPPLRADEACGAAGINGLLWVARRRGLVARLLDLRSSGDTAGPRNEVVGYGAFAFDEHALS